MSIRWIPACHEEFRKIPLTAAITGTTPYPRSVLLILLRGPSRRTSHGRTQPGTLRNGDRPATNKLGSKHDSGCWSTESFGRVSVFRRHPRTMYVPPRITNSKTPLTMEIADICSREMGNERWLCMCRSRCLMKAKTKSRFRTATSISSSAVHFLGLRNRDHG
jgi:hypothetical protein